MGRLTKDPAEHQTQSGNKCATFPIAVRRRFKNAEGNYDADFIDCVAWRQNAEYAIKYLVKGHRVAVEGAMQSRSYSAQDGSNRRVMELIVDNIESLAERNTDAQQSAPAANKVLEFEEIDDAGDELPF